MKIPQISFYTPQKIEKNWGYELLIDNNDKYCGKILHYNYQNFKSSAHFHYEKSESMLCKFGSFAFWYWDDKGNKQMKIMKPGDCVRINAGRMHQLESLEAHSEMFETSTFHSDEDVYRTEPSQSI